MTELESIINTQSLIAVLKQASINLEKTIKDATEELADNQKLLYESQEKELHLQEILRLAAMHLPRLKKQKELTQTDYSELEKWIRRSKSNEGLKSIVMALREMGKYQSYDIKTNLYALIQKIIIEGPNKKN